MFRFPASRFLTAGAVAGVAARRRATLARGRAMGFCGASWGWFTAYLPLLPILLQLEG